MNNYIVMYSVGRIPSSPWSTSRRGRRERGPGRGLAARLLLAAGLAAAPLHAQVGDTTRAAPPPRAGVVVRALVHVEHVSGEPAETPPERGFGLRRVRLIAQGPLDGRTSARLMVDPTVLAVSAAGAAPFRGVPLVEAQLDYRLSAAATVRAGQQRLPFGLAATTLAPSHPLPEYPLASRLLMQRVSAFRDIGVALVGQHGAWEFGGGAFGGAGINVRRDNDGSRDLIARATFAPLPGWSLGASGWRGHSGTLYRVDGAPRRTFHDEADFVRWGLDARLDRGGIRVAAEYLADRTDPAPGAAHPVPTAGALRRSGWYVEGSGRPLPRLEMAARYDRWDGGLAGGDIEEVSGGASWYLNERTAPDHPRRGRPASAVQLSNRIMAFAESVRAGAGDREIRLRVRWEVLF